MDDRSSEQAALSAGRGGGGFRALLPQLARLAGLPAPWMVAGGWALDLYLGEVSRPHADVDVAIYRHDQHVVGSWLGARGWMLQQVAGGQLRPWDARDTIIPPVHELHIRHPDTGDALELLLNEGSAHEWRYRRPAAITRPRSQVELRSAEGIPFLAPEVVLLFKSARPEEKDEADFARIFPRLAPEPREWLRAALASLHPQHPWLA